jgi:deoxyribonuclease-4
VAEKGRKAIRRLGIHTSTAGSLENAALHAAELGANTFQIFSASPRMWRARLPDPAQIRLLAAARRRFDLNPLVIHVSYLVNLASADPVIRAKSIAAFRGELERAAAIGAEYLVLHPGSCRGRSVEEGIADSVAALRAAAAGFHSRGLTVLLENTAGAGSHLGSRFEELASFRERAGRLTHLPIGYCLDTCHLLAAGFDITTPAGLRETVRSAESLLGLANVRVFHVNFHSQRPQSGFRLIPVQERQPRFIHGSRLPHNHFIQKLFLGPIVVMDGRQIDPGLRDDVPQRRGGIPLIAEQPFRRVQDPLICFGHSINSIKQLYYTTDSRIVKRQAPVLTPLVDRGAAPDSDREHVN